MKMNILIIDMNEDFTCTCVNTSFAEGFFPCDDIGKPMEPVQNWKGLYRCDKCGQIIKNNK